MGPVAVDLAEIFLREHPKIMSILFSLFAKLLDQRRHTHHDPDHLEMSFESFVQVYHFRLFLLLTITLIPYDNASYVHI
jgi:hypothetical protein